MNFYKEKIKIDISNTTKKFENLELNINLLKSNNINNINKSSSQIKRYLNNLNSSKIKKNNLEEITSNKKKDESSSIKENGLITENPVVNTDCEKLNVENENFFNGDISFTDKSPNIKHKTLLSVETEENNIINTFKLSPNNYNKKNKEKKEDYLLNLKKNTLLKFQVIS